MTAVQTPNEPAPARIIGRYALFGEIASGGMATVHFGRLLGPVGFARTGTSGRRETSGPICDISPRCRW